MSEKPISGSEVVDPKFLDEAIKKAKKFLVINKKLTGVLSSNLAITKKSIEGLKINNSEGLKQQIALNKDAERNLEHLEVLKKKAAQTSEALSKVNIAKLKEEQQEIRKSESLKKQAESDSKKRAKIQSEANKEIARSKAALDKIDKESAKTLQNNLSIYEQTKKKYNDLSRAQIELAVRGRENGKVFRGIKIEADALRATLDKAEQGAGRFQRNVGNYASAFDGLGNSVNQLTREFPAFAVSAQTGFLAISNNLPILFDQIEKIKKANESLAAEGKKGVSVLKQLAGAVFSVGSILSIGVTLLTLYGKEIVEWTAALFDGEKQLKSITEANDLYNKSISATRETINGLKIDLKVQSGILTKFQGDQLKNENERVKALNEAKKLKFDRIAALREELGLTKDLKLENSAVNIALKTTSQAGFDAKQVLQVQRYNNELARLNKLSRTDIDAINERYNLEVKLQKIKGTGTGSNTRLVEKETKEELIIQKHAYDEIRQLDIDAMTDERQRREQQVIFNRDKVLSQIELENNITKLKLKTEEDNYNQSIDLLEKNSKKTTLGFKQLSIDLAKLETDHLQKVAKINAENIPVDEQNELIKLSTIKANNELLAIDKEFYDKQVQLNIEAAKKTQEARRKINEDNLNFEIQQLERNYNEQQKTISGFNLRETNNLEREISAKKVAKIKADADEKVAKLKADEDEVEKLAILNEARIAIEKETQRSDDQIKANRKTVLNQALQFEQQILDAIAKAEAEKSALRQASFDKQITEADKNIETQRKLAEKGAANTLEAEEANKIKLERQKEEEKQQEIKRQKVLAFFKLFSSYAEKDPNTALQKALTDTELAEAVSAAFIDGTENVGKDKQFTGNKFSNGKDGYLARFDGDERILNPEQNKKIGNLSNEALADLAHKHNNGLLDTVKFAAIPTDNFAKNIENSALLQQNAVLIKEIQSVREAIKSKPELNINFTKQGDYISEQIENGFRKRTLHKQRKPRI